MEETSSSQQVTVKVDAGGTITCVPDPVPVKGRNVLLHFVLQADGYVFPQSDAIVIDPPSPQFPQASRTLPPSDTTATLLDLNTMAGDFKYTVAVQDVGTGKRIELDPMIRNDP